MSQIRSILRIQNDPSKNEQGFKMELERALNLIMERLDELQGLRGELKIYSDMNLQDNKISFNDEGYLKLEDIQKKLQYYDKLSETWKSIEGSENIDKLTSQSGAGSTFKLTDDSTNQTLTGNKGDITIVPAGGDVAITGSLSATGEISIEATPSDVTGSRALTTIYRNTGTTTKVAHVCVNIT